MTHTVKAGDTLSQIARAHGTTIAQFLDANPRLRADPNRLRVGDVLTVPGTAAPPSAAATPPASTPSPQPAAPHLLGGLSERFETSGRGPGTVSGGQGDPGGVSYGSYQMTSKRDGGTVKVFISQRDFPFRETFRNLTPGSAEFTAAWKAVARDHRDAFQAAQHEFIKQTHFDPLVKKIQREDGLDVLTRCHTVQDVIWSTAVQHGPGSSIPHAVLGKLDALPSDSAFDRKFITAIYAERGRTKDDGGLVHFPRVGAELRPGLLRRFREEARLALEALDRESRV